MLSIAAPHQATITTETVIVDDVTYQIELILDRRLNDPYLLTVTATTWLGRMRIVKTAFSSLATAHQQLLDYQAGLHS